MSECEVDHDEFLDSTVNLTNMGIDIGDRPIRCPICRANLEQEK